MAVAAIGYFSMKATNQGGMRKWRSPRAAVIPNFHLPMRSYEVKNRTNVDDIKSLRLITAVKTPYLPDGRFDLEAYDTLINMQIEDGVEGVIVGGTTGEGQLMSWDEHIMLIGHTVNCFGQSIKVIGNTGSNSTREAIHATEQGFAVGMHAALHINPYYGTVQNGFTATSYGGGADEIYGLAQCRGDVSKNNCSVCIKNAAREILNLCPSQTDARIWYDYCFLRYNTVNFFGQVDTSGAYLINVQNVTEPFVFTEKLRALTDRIRSEAVEPANKRLGKGECEISPSVTLYGLVQCTRDLSERDCGRCLATAIGNFPRFCGNRRGCQALYSSCTTRYELYPFFF